MFCGEGRWWREGRECATTKLTMSFRFRTQIRSLDCNADMPPFLGFGRRRVTWLVIFVLVFLGLSWHLSSSREEEEEEQDFADEEVSLDFPSLPSLLLLLSSTCFLETLTHFTSIASVYRPTLDPKLLPPPESLQPTPFPFSSSSSSFLLRNPTRPSPPATLPLGMAHPRHPA